MLIGWGGNNGSTLTAGILANRLGIDWKSKRGACSPNYYGSLMLSSTIRLGRDENNESVNVPFYEVLPMAHPNDFILGGWDISKANLEEAMERAQVLEPTLQEKLAPIMRKMRPLPGIYSPAYVASNQAQRADNLIGGRLREKLEKIRLDIRNFAEASHLEKVVVVWTANTEKLCPVVDGVNDTWKNLERAIDLNSDQISPSTIYAVAAVLEGCDYINGSPQNTFVPGLLELADQRGVHLAGDDFKSGQTKIKSVLTDFLIQAGIKPLAITSYNHLGNNDGLNLSEAEQFQSKELSKSGVISDMVRSNPLLFKGEHPDHTVVIKYVPSVGDSKRALDEYESEIFLHGRNTIVLHNTCEDSLLAAPIIIDLILLTELIGRISVQTADGGNFQPFSSVLGILGYLLKAPQVPSGMPVVNALFRQRAAIENLFRACRGLAPENELMLGSAVCSK